MLGDAGVNAPDKLVCVLGLFVVDGMEAVYGRARGRVPPGFSDGELLQAGRRQWM